MLVHFSGKPFTFNPPEREGLFFGVTDMCRGERIAENWMLGAL